MVPTLTPRERLSTSVVLTAGLPGKLVSLLRYNRSRLPQRLIEAGCQAFHDIEATRATRNTPAD